MVRSCSLSAGDRSVVCVGVWSGGELLVASCGCGSALRLLSGAIEGSYSSLSWRRCANPDKLDQLRELADVAGRWPGIRSR